MSQPDRNTLVQEAKALGLVIRRLTVWLNATQCRLSATKLDELFAERLHQMAKLTALQAVLLSERGPRAAQVRVYKTGQLGVAFGDDVEIVTDALDAVDDPRQARALGLVAQRKLHHLGYPANLVFPFFAPSC